MKTLLTLFLVAFAATVYAQKPKIQEHETDPFNGKEIIRTNGCKIATGENGYGDLWLRCIVIINEGDTIRYAKFSSSSDLGCCGTGKGSLKLLHDDNTTTEYKELSSDISCSDYCGLYFLVDSFNELTRIKMIRIAAAKHYKDFELWRDNLDKFVELMSKYN